jgi:predicted phosphohydrolase
MGQKFTPWSNFPFRKNNFVLRNLLHGVKNIKKTTLLLFAAATIFFFTPLSAKAFTLNLVSDIHAGNSDNCGDFKCVPRWREAFQEFLDETEGLIVTVGDNTDMTSKTYATELRQMAEGREIYWANGNHDKKVYVGGSKHYVIDEDDWRIVLIDYKNCGKKDVNWLKKTLKNYKTAKVAAVLHYPVFKRETAKIQKDCKKIEKVFRDYSVDYVFSGHWHGDEWTRTYNGVSYRAIKGLTNGFATNYLSLELE